MKQEIQQIVNKLQSCKDAYYNLGKSVISDDEFDHLEDELRGLDPDNDYFTIVGTGNIKEKVKHAIPMLSLQKGKTVDDILVWIKKIEIQNEDFIVQSKVDGLSCSVVYEKGKLVMIKTRGDGNVGQNITHISKFTNIPNKINLNKINRVVPIEVRGELYLPKNTLLSNPENKPLRNLAVGLINRKDNGLEDLRYLHFVAYQTEFNLRYLTSVESYKMKWLIENNFETVWWKLFSLESLKQNYRMLRPIEKPINSDFITALYNLYLNELRDSWNYESDGLVFTVNNNKFWGEIDSKYEVSHHHHYNMALKPPSQGKETVLEGIEWNVSRQGKVIPVALVKTVVLGGSNVSRCTLNNYENVLKLRLNVGDKIFIERAGDVIPFFKNNLSMDSNRKSNLIPECCSSCGGKLLESGVHLVCLNDECEEQQILKIVHWVKCCEMEQFSEASVRALFKVGLLRDIVSLYSLKAKDFESVEGFGSKKIENALNQIDSTRYMSIGQFVDRLGIDLVGEKAMKKLGITTVEQLLNFNDSTFVIGRNLMEYLSENKSYVKKLLQIVKIQKPQEVKMGARNVCMTGKGPKTRNELIVEIQKKGDTFVDHVGKETNILVCEDPNSNSSKLQKAQKFGVKLMSYSDYFGS